MNLNQDAVVMWANVPYTVTTTIDALVHLGYNVNVNYTPGGIFVSITRLGRGQAHSGIDEAEVLSELLARMIATEDIPATANPQKPPAPKVVLAKEVVEDARDKVEAVTQTASGLREAAKEGLLEESSSGDFKQPQVKAKK